MSSHGRLESRCASYLADLIHHIQSAPLTHEDRLIVRQHLLDSIASAFIGFRNHVFSDLARLSPKGKDGCAWPGSGEERVHPFDGAMLWALAINGSVFDDGSREGACHPGAAVIPAIIALSAGKDWDKIDRAIIAGYDVMVRLARSGNPEFTRRGFHPASIIAPFAAAAAASCLLGHTPLQTQNALCLAALGSAGLMASFRSGDTQPLQVAGSVRSGMVSASLAGLGHAGYSGILEEGFFPAYLGSPPRVPVDQSLEFEYAIQGSYIKPYPGCRHVHPSIDALADIVSRISIDPGQIREIRVRTYKIAVETEIDPIHTRGDAYFNIPYALASRIILGRNDWDSFSEKYFDRPELIELMEKIHVTVDPRIESLYPKRRGALVELLLRNGDKHCKEVEHPLGEPENPLPAAIIKEKFRTAAASFLSETSMAAVERLLDPSCKKCEFEVIVGMLSENKDVEKGAYR
jgi:2-methylcitrate dehydratase PrpD